MSSIRRNKYGYYYIDIRKDKKRIRITLNTKDRKIAAIRAKIKQHDLQVGKLVYRITIEDFKKEYLEYSRSRKALNTVKADEYAFSKLQKVITFRYLDEITPKHADSFVTFIRQKLSPAGTNFYIRSLRTIFNTAVRWDYLASNPFKMAQQIKFELPIPRVLTVKEIEAILSTTKKVQPELVPLFEFYILTGTRRSEALHLEWKDIDFKNNLITLRNTKSKRPRIIPMVPKVRSILASRQKNSNPFMFKKDYVSRHFTLMAKASGVKDVKLHDLRKSFSTYIQEMGMPPLIVSKLIGHVDKETTERYYTGYYDEMIRKYFALLERKIFPN